MYKECSCPKITRKFINWETALTGYLVQSFLATYVFYGLDCLFGQVNRIEQLAIVTFFGPFDVVFQSG